MSKNFELMQNIGVGLEPSPTPEVSHANPVPIERSGSRRLHTGPFEFDQQAHEECLQLVQRLFLLQSEPPHCVVFAGIEHGNGCSWICAQIAELLSENTPGSVCLVEANLRSPSLAQTFGVPNHRGLTDALLEDGPVADFAKRLRRSNLWLLSCGSLASDSDFPSLLNSERLSQRLSELRDGFDYVLVDTPPLRQYGDAVTLGWLADGLVLVLEANSTRREFARLIAETLQATQVKLLAAVLNKRTFPIPRMLYERL
jgi:Mrp family chromosome partitioning ATPase